MHLGDNISIVASDFAVALPIVLISLYLVLSSIHSGQLFYTGYARSAYSELRYYSVSQQILEISGTGSNNYTSEASLIGNLSRNYNVSVSFLEPGSPANCSRLCRIVEIDGITKIMVIR